VRFIRRGGGGAGHQAANAATASPIRRLSCRSAEARDYVLLTRSRCEAASRGRPRSVPEQQGYRGKHYGSAEHGGQGRALAEEQAAQRDGDDGVDKGIGGYGGRRQPA
jgi:hypothetical protein